MSWNVLAGQHVDVAPFCFIERQRNVRTYCLSTRLICFLFFCFSFSSLEQRRTAMMNDEVSSLMAHSIYHR